MAKSLLVRQPNQLGQNAHFVRWTPRFAQGVRLLGYFIEQLAMDIRPDDPRKPEITSLLRKHLQDMADVSPPQSRHALEIDELCEPDVTFWGLWDDSQIAGCAALKELDQTHGEIKSMRTATPYLRQGVAETLLVYLMDEAVSRGYKRLSLETGSMAFFEPARALYSKFGFVYVAPFGDYVEDPNSVFMSKDL